jgi:hypothetical protein
MDEWIENPFWFLAIPKIENGVKEISWLNEGHIFSNHKKSL